MGPRLPKVSGSAEREGGRTRVGEGVAFREEVRGGEVWTWVASVNAAHSSHGKVASWSQENSRRQGTVRS